MLTQRIPSLKNTSSPMRGVSGWSRHFIRQWPRGIGRAREAVTAARNARHGRRRSDKTDAQSKMRTVYGWSGSAAVARSSVVGYAVALLLPLVVLLAVNRSQLPVFVFQHVIVLLVAACAIGWGCVSPW